MCADGDLSIQEAFQIQERILFKGGQSDVLYLVVKQIDVSDKRGSVRSYPEPLPAADISTVRSLLFPFVS